MNLLLDKENGHIYCIQVFLFYEVEKSPFKSYIYFNSSNTTTLTYTC